MEIHLNVISTRGDPHLRSQNKILVQFHASLSQVLFCIEFCTQGTLSYRTLRSTFL